MERFANFSLVLGFCLVKVTLSENSVTDSFPPYNLATYRPGAACSGYNDHRRKSCHLEGRVKYLLRNNQSVQWLPHVTPDSLFLGAERDIYVHPDRQTDRQTDRTSASASSSSSVLIAFSFPSCQPEAIQTGYQGGCSMCTYYACDE